MHKKHLYQYGILYILLVLLIIISNTATNKLLMAATNTDSTLQIPSHIDQTCNKKVTDVPSTPKKNITVKKKTLTHQSLPPGEIALSFDDVPMPSTILFNGLKRTKRLIAALKNAQCPAVGIFAIGSNALSKLNRDRLILYAEAGHIIANHTYSHYKLSTTADQIFIEDIQKAHQLFSELPNFKLFFRFPYLSEGKDAQQRQTIITALNQMGYQEGYVTVSNNDYYLNKKLLDAVKSNKNIDYQKLKEIYIEMLWSCITANHLLAHKVIGRPVKHVLLLHENDIAALFIEDLIAYIRQQGWKIISIEEAYQDPIANYPIKNTYSHMGRLNAIAVEKGLGKNLVTFDDKVSLKGIDKIIREKEVFSRPTSTIANSEH